MDVVTQKMHWNIFPDEYRQHAGTTFLECCHSPHHLCQVFLPDWEVSVAYPDPWCGISLLDRCGCNWQRAAFFRVLDIKSHINLFSRGWYAAGIALSELLRFFISPEERKQPKGLAPSLQLSNLCWHEYNCKSQFGLKSHKKYEPWDFH